MKIKPINKSNGSYRPDFDAIWRWFLLQGIFGSIMLGIGIKVGWEVHDYQKMLKEAEEGRELPAIRVEARPQN